MGAQWVPYKGLLPQGLLPGPSPLHFSAMELGAELSQGAWGLEEAEGARPAKPRPTFLELSRRHPEGILAPESSFSPRKGIVGVDPACRGRSPGPGAWSHTGRAPGPPCPFLGRRTSRRWAVLTAGSGVKVAGEPTRGNQAFLFPVAQALVLGALPTRQTAPPKAGRMLGDKDLPAGHFSYTGPPSPLPPPPPWEAALRAAAPALVTAGPSAGSWGRCRPARPDPRPQEARERRCRSSPRPSAACGAVLSAARLSLLAN